MNSEPNTPKPNGPTADDLGGIPVTSEGPGDTTIRPRRSFIKVPAKLPDPHAKPTLEDLAGIPVCFGDDEPPRQSSTPAKPDEPPAV